MGCTVELGRRREKEGGTRLNRNRIRQRCSAFRGYTTQKIPVLVEHQVVVCLRFLALLPGWISQTDVILLQPRAPEFHDNVLRAGCSDCAISLRLTRSADPVLARQALLGPDDCALNAVPDLACGARLLDGVSRAAGATHVTVLDDTRGRCTGAIFAV